MEKEGGKEGVRKGGWKKGGGGGGRGLNQYVIYLAICCRFHCEED